MFPADTKGATGRRALGLALTAVAVASMAVPSAAAAERDGGRLVLSVDGVAWVHDVTSPMFDASHVWVAGDAATYSVLLRNDSGEPAEAFAEMEVTGDAAAVFDTRLRLDDGEWVAGPRSQIVPVESGQVVRLDLELALPGDAVNPRTPLTADVAAKVTLRGGDPDGGGPGDGSGPGDGGDGTSGGQTPDGGTSDGSGAGSGGSSSGSEGLALTGARPVVIATLGALLAAIGARLVVVTRRRARDDASSSSAESGAL